MTKEEKIKEICRDSIDKLGGALSEAYGAFTLRYGLILRPKRKKHLRRLRST